MSIDINLISKSSESLREPKLKKIRTISATVLFIVGAMSLILFLINYRFSANYVKKEQDKLIEQLSVYDETASKIFLLNQRLSDISELLSTREIYHEKAEKIIDKIPTSVVVQEFQIDNSGIVISVNSNSLDDLNKFLNDILSLYKSKVLSGVALDSLTTVGTGYMMIIKAI